jgi:mannose-6-phosphate isomerase-like protein (cupin superfamily)
MKAFYDLPDVTDFEAMDWIQKQPGIYIKEISRDADIAVDFGRFTSAYPMHEFQTIKEVLHITAGKCKIIFLSGGELTLEVGQQIIIPPHTAFAIEPIAVLQDMPPLVEMIIATTPAWFEEDIVMHE